MRRLIAGLVTANLLIGCAAPRDPARAYVNIHSEPDGAQVYITTSAGLTALGFAPQLVHYPISDAARAAGSVKSSVVELRWASGATRRGSITIPLTGRDLEYVVRRPADAPGLDRDYQFALQIQQSRQVEQANKDAATANALAIILGGAAAYQAGRNSAPAPLYIDSPRQPIRCTTSVIGQIANTNCN